MATARKSVSHLYLHAGVLRVGCLVGEASAGDYGRGIYATGGARDCSARSCPGVLCAEQRGELWARGDNVWQRGARLPMPSQRVTFLMRYGGRPVAGGGGVHTLCWVRECLAFENCWCWRVVLCWQDIQNFEVLGSEFSYKKFVMIQYSCVWLVINPLLELNWYMNNT